MEMKNSKNENEFELQARRHKTQQQKSGFCRQFLFLISSSREIRFFLRLFLRLFFYSFIVSPAHYNCSFRFIGGKKTCVFGANTKMSSQDGTKQQIKLNSIRNEHCVKKNFYDSSLRFATVNRRCRRRRMQA